MIGNKNRFGLFAPLVEWEEVKNYKVLNQNKKLPNSYIGYLTHDFYHIFQRIPVSLYTVSSVIKPRSMPIATERGLNTDPGCLFA